MTEREEIRVWLKSKLAEAGHGSKSKLAKHLGVSSDAITRMLNEEDGKETRQISAVEHVKMQEFFASEGGKPGAREVTPASEPKPASMEKRYRNLPAPLQKVFEAQLSALEQLAAPTPSSDPQAKDDQE